MLHIIICRQCQRSTSSIILFIDGHSQMKVSKCLISPSCKDGGLMKHQLLQYAVTTHTSKARLIYKATGQEKFCGLPRSQWHLMCFLQLITLVQVVYFSPNKPQVIVDKKWNPYFLNSMSTSYGRTIWYSNFVEATQIWAWLVSGQKKFCWEP